VADSIRTFRPGDRRPGPAGQDEQPGGPEQPARRAVTPPGAPAPPASPPPAAVTPVPPVAPAPPVAPVSPAAPGSAAAPVPPVPSAVPAPVVPPGPPAASAASPAPAPPATAAAPSASAAASAPASRWAQITYASFDRGDGVPGGWQVKDTLGEPDADELRLLRRSVVSRFSFHGSLPAFLSAEEAEALPVRMRFRPSGPGSPGVLTHAVPAGADSTGRPGNVYSHVALDRGPSGAERPIDLWRSSAFARPYGVEAILRTRPVTEPQAHPEGFGRTETVASLLTTPGYTEPFLAAADALTEAVRGGRRLVLVTDRQDWAALVITVLTHLTSPALARCIGWSLYERADDLGSKELRGAHIVTVPEADAGRLSEREDVFVLADGDLPVRGEDGSHLVRQGPAIPASPFSALMEAVAAVPEQLPARLRALEALDARFPLAADEVVEPAWALAVVVDEAAAGPTAAGATQGAAAHGAAAQGAAAQGVAEAGDSSGHDGTGAGPGATGTGQGGAEAAAAGGEPPLPPAVRAAVEALMGRSAPRSARADRGRAKSIVSALTPRMGSTAAEAWALLGELDPARSAVQHALVARTALLRTLDEGVPEAAPPASRLHGDPSRADDDALVQAAADAVERVLKASGEAHGEDRRALALHAFQLANLLADAGIYVSSEASPQLEARLVEMFETVPAVQDVWRPGGEHLVREIGRLAPGIPALVIAGLCQGTAPVAEAGAPSPGAGTGAPPPVTEVFADLLLAHGAADAVLPRASAPQAAVPPGGGAPPSSFSGSAEAADSSTPAGRLTAQLLGRLLIHGERRDLLPLWVRLAAGLSPDSRQAPEDAQSVLTALHPTPGELAEMEDAAPCWLVTEPHLLLPLLTQPWEPGLERLCGILVRTRIWYSRGHRLALLLQAAYDDAGAQDIEPSEALRVLMSPLTHDGPEPEWAHARALSSDLFAALLRTVLLRADALREAAERDTGVPAAEAHVWPGFAFGEAALPGTAQPGTALPGTALPGTAQPGTAKPGEGMDAAVFARRLRSLVPEAVDAAAVAGRLGVRPSQRSGTAPAPTGPEHSEPLPGGAPLSAPAHSEQRHPAVGPPVPEASPPAPAPAPGHARWAPGGLGGGPAPQPYRWRPDPHSTLVGLAELALAERLQQRGFALLLPAEAELLALAADAPEAEVQSAEAHTEAGGRRARGGRRGRPVQGASLFQEVLLVGLQSTERELRDILAEAGGRLEAEAADRVARAAAHSAGRAASRVPRPRDMDAAIDELALGLGAQLGGEDMARSTGRSGHDAGGGRSLFSRFGRKDEETR
jgi:hypothetical protein